MAKSDSKVVTPRLPLPVADKVDLLAVRLERPRASVARKARSPWFVHATDRSLLTREALANVDANQVIDHQSVLAWANSLGTDKPLQMPQP